jgi:tetratricopeptide (TPR) repeat protein
VQTKVNDLKVAEQTRDKLLLENSFLKTRLEATQFECRAEKAALAANEIGSKLKSDTGSTVGRTPASLHYQVPADLLPKQLYTLGVSYFKARDDEKAAVIFSMLSSMQDTPEFKTAKNFVMAGVSWYRLQNYEMAQTYFNQALSLNSSPEEQPYLVQARLWRGLAAERMGHHADAQKYLRDLLDHYPHSTEAQWVNVTETKRDPASISHSE